jgi:threonine aldolase
LPDKYAHVYHYEMGELFNSGVFLADGDRGMITAEQVAGAINDPEFYHNPLTSLVWKTQLIKEAVLVMRRFKKIKGVEE